MIGPSSSIVRMAIATLMKGVNAPAVNSAMAFPLPLDCSHDYAIHYDEAVKLIREAFLRELDDKTAHRQRNVQRPVGAIPTELLVEIIDVSLMSNRKNDDTTGDHSYLLKLARVCSRWWHVIKSTPRFWVNIHESSLSSVRCQLLRSGLLPLSINFRPLYHTPTLDLMRIAAQHSWRWRSLTLRAPEEDYERMTGHLNGFIPLLEEVTLLNEDVGDGGATVAFGGGSQLQKLHISHLVLRLPRSSGEFRSLTHLNLTGIILPDPSYLQGLLEHFRSLKELCLGGVCGSWGRSLDGRPLQVSLPKLEHLELERGNDSDVWVPLLQGIHAENLKLLSVADGYVQAGFASLAYPTTSGRISLLQRVLNSGRVLVITIKAIDGLLSIYDGVERTSSWLDRRQRKLTIEVQDVDSTSIEALRYLSFGSTKLHIRLGEGSNPSFLQFAPSTEILIICDCLGIEGIMRYTTFLSTPDDRSADIPCPQLLRLHLELKGAGSGGSSLSADEDRQLVEAVRHLIRSRRSMSGSQTGFGAASHAGIPEVTFGGEHCRFDEATGQFMNDL